MTNFNEIFRNDKAYDNITKNRGFHGFTLSLEDTFFEKTQGFRFNGSRRLTSPYCCTLANGQRVETPLKCPFSEFLYIYVCILLCKSKVGVNS